MSLRLGETAPNFTADTTEGRLTFHEWLGNSWGILFSHPKDFTPVCTTELGRVAKLKPEFDRRNVKVVGLSVDPVESHRKWAKDIEETQGAAPNFPMIGDPELAVAKLYEMLPETAGATSDGRTAADNQTVRTVYVVGPDKKIKLTLLYPMTTGRNFDEILRVVDSLQLTATHRVSTPADWKQGDDVIIAGSVSNDEAKKIYPDGWKEPKPYIRIVPEPGGRATVHYKKENIGTFPVTTDKVFAYMSHGGHLHAAIKRHELVDIKGNVVTIDAEFYQPDGSTFQTTIQHRLNRPNGIESRMIGGAFDGARFTHSYTPLGDSTRVDLEGDFPTMPGLPASEELKMIDGMFSTFFAEDTNTLRHLV